MKERIYKFTIWLLPKGLKFRIQLPLIHQLRELNKSFSQEGEDMILNRFLGNKEKIFYVDVGAHHPTKFSNTKKFYDSGKGRGINIDALPGTKKLFDEHRPEDINIECGIAVEAGELTYYNFYKPAHNTFEEKIANFKIAKGIELKEKILIPVKRLDQLLDNHSVKYPIDFLTIDVEGMDFEVLKSNNWQKYRPNIICVEDLGQKTIEEIVKGELYHFLSELNYQFIAKSFNTLFFKNEQWN